MITIQADLAAKRLNTLSRELEYVSTATFLRTLGLKSYSEDALEYLKSIFPVSPDAGLRWSRSKREFGMHMIEGFRVVNKSTAKGVSFTISHELNSNSRARKVLAVIDKGSGTRQFRVKRGFRFPGDAQFSKGYAGKGAKSKIGWFRMKRGATMTHAATPAYDYVSRTQEYIESVLMVSLKEKFESRVASRIKRI